MENKFLDDFSKEVWETTFKDHKDNNLDDTLRRVARTVASAEKESEKELWEERFYKILSNFKFTVGGRVYSNAGTEWKGTTWHNCFVGPKPKYDQDSIEGIFNILYTQAKTLKSEGGWGMNFSFIRPRGSFINGIGVESPGSIKYMELFDKSSDIITAGSGKKSTNKKTKGKIRKGAMMGMLFCWHPDIEEFITAKLQEGRLSKFNISVACTDEFMDKLVKIDKLKSEGKDIPEELDKWDLVFPDTKHEKYKEEWNGNIYKWQVKGYPVNVWKTVKITDLWDKIMTSTYTRNDPGIFFVDRANYTHCWNYGENSEIQATNPCGEQSLPFGANCDLGSFNLTQYFNLKTREFDFDSFEKDIHLAVRMLDNINEISPSPLEEYTDAMRHRRRIGLGIMGWGSLLYLMKIRFSSNEAYKLQQKIMMVLTHSATEASINLAEEKGMFRDCDPIKHANHPYWKSINLPDYLIERMKKIGIRNSSLFSIQPTGNTGVLANIVTGGLEPMFGQEWIRTVILQQPPDEIKDFCPKYYEGDFKPNKYFKLTKEGNDDILRCENNGTVYKIDKNRGLTKEVECQDYSVRLLKSIGEWNSKADWAVTAFDLTVEEHVRDMEGFAQWIDSSVSKTINIENDYPYTYFKNIYLNAYKGGKVKGITTYRAGTMMNVLALKEEKKISNHAPKRPDKINCEVLSVKVNKEKFFVIIGMLEGSPYEVFAGKQDFELDSLKQSGILEKVKRGHYQLKVDNQVICDNVCDHLDNEEEIVTRLVSTNLRHKVDLNFLVHQIEKSKGNLNSLGKAIARCLKKYIMDGTEVSGEECPDCKGKLIRSEGCVACRCGFSKCG